MTAAWILVTDADRLAACVALARGAGASVTCAVVGPRELADLAAAAGPDEVRWLEPAAEVPAEAYAAPLAAAVAAAGPQLLVSTSAPASRVLLGAAAARLGAALVPGVLAVRADGEVLVVDRAALDGAVVETLAVTGPLAAIADPGDDPEPSASTAPVTVLDGGAPAALRVEQRQAGAATSGVRDAARVVSVGRGLKAKADLDVIAPLLDALGAELGCTMPVADDLGWVAKERYVGRSGQHIAPRLYLALGISGAPQHLEGVRDARVVVAVNTDPQAPIFSAADYGIVGDLYDVVPALVDALHR
ncbi:MAG: FAD-binding protein [Actinobacteria bacterium]|nr:FAD-binding protein [Actinomycetota bacterium]MCG2800711.1 FAD-binding protein [Cellulomonas sp.]